MVGESQFEKWRKDFASNMEKLGKALADDDDKRARLAEAAMRGIPTIMMAERIGLLALSLNRNDEVLAQYIDRTQSGEQIVERLINALSKMEGDLPEELEVLQDFAMSWLRNEGDIIFKPPPQSA